MRCHVLTAGVLALSSAFAAQPDGAVDETITVIAHRTPQPLDRAGSAVSVVDRAEIDVRQVAVSAEALRPVPGLAIARSGPIGAQTQVRMRGAEANQVLVLIDGVEANDLATDDAFSFEHLTTFDIERIEVVRGPQSALWGSDALAGVINVVTRRPREPLDTGAFVEGGSFGFLNGGARLGLLGEDGWLAVSASRLDVDGTNAARAGDEDDGYDNVSATLAGSLRVLPGLTLDGNVRHTDSTTEYDANDYVDGVLVAVDADNETEGRQTYARAGGELAVFEGRWLQKLHYALTEVDTDTRSENLFEGGYDLGTTNGKKYGLYYQSSFRVRGGRGDTPADQLSIALDHEREEFSQRGEVSVFGDPNQDQDLHTTGYAAEYVAWLGPDLTLSASARHDDNSDFGDVNTWRATAAWQVAEISRLHGSFGTGFKAPTFYERFGFTPDQFVGNPDLDPETSRGWDLGVTQAWLDARLVADVTYFRADLDDEINGFYCADFPCTAINESGESERKGVEARVDYALDDTYALGASYTYLDASQSNPQPDGSDPGIAEIRRPRHSGSLELTGRWLDGRLVANAGAFYTGDREDDTFTLAPPFVARETLDAYTLVNLALGYDFAPGFTLYGRVENALDEDYEDVFGYATPGAAAYVGLRMDLGR